MATQNLALSVHSSSLTNGGAARQLSRAYSDRMTMPEAIEAVGRMIAGYANGNKPDSYIGTIAALLREYPRSVAKACADPVKGVARKTKFLPTVADVVAWCEPQVDAMRSVVEYDRRSAEQLRERQERQQAPVHNPDVMERVRREMAAAGMPILGDRKRCHGETPETVRAKLGLSEQQWNAIPDAGTKWRRP